MLGLLVVLGLIAAGVMTACIYKKIDLGRLVIIGGSTYIAFYFIFSGILFWMDTFTLTAPAVITLIIEVMIAVTILFMNDFVFPKISGNFRMYIPLAIILVGAGIIANLNPAGFYGTGQDQGLYQIRAMFYMGESYDMVIDFPEYYEIDNAYERGHYVEEVEDLVGFYLQRDSGEEEAKTLEGILHGVPTFPAILALWAKIFKLHNMNGSLVLLYLLTIANTWLLCDNLKFKQVTKCVICVLLSICPILLWNAKNTLTEIGIAMLISFFMELLTENSKKRLALFSVIPFIAACFLHVTLAILLPMFVVLYIWNYLQTKDAKYLVALSIGLLGYAMGISMMMTRVHYYTANNLEVLFGKTKYLLNENNLLPVVWISVSVFSIALIICGVSSLGNRILNNWKKLKNSKKGTQGVSIFMVAFAIITLASLVSRIILSNKNGWYLSRMSIVCFILTTGFVMVPLAFLGVFLLRKQFMIKRNMFNIYFSFLYVILMYCGVVWGSIVYYYYYTRYYVPFVFLILLSAGYLLEQIKWQAVVPISAVCAAIVIWQSNLLYTDRDLTYGDYTVLESMASCVGENDCILIYEQGYHVQRLFALQLKGLTGVDIYYADTVRIKAQIESYNALYDNVFVLTYDVGGKFSDEDEDWRSVYRGMLHMSIYDGNIEKGDLPYAKSVVKIDSPVALYILENDMTENVYY